MNPFRFLYQNHKLSYSIWKSFNIELQSLNIDDMISDACLSRPCYLGGTCVPNSDGPYECLCQPGSTGEDCSIDGTII